MGPDPDAKAVVPQTPHPDGAAVALGNVEALMSSVVAGPFFVVSGLVGLAGAAKVLRPGGTARALRAAGLPGSPGLGRLVGAGELALAAAAIAIGSRSLALVVGAAYLGFATFTLRLIARQGGTADCGCFGQSSSPATSLHVALNLAAAGVATTAAVAPPGPIGSVLAGQPVGGIPLLALVGLAIWLAFGAFTLLPEVQRATARPRSAPGR